LCNTIADIAAIAPPAPAPTNFQTCLSFLLAPWLLQAVKAPKSDDPVEAAKQESALSQAFTIVMQRQQMRVFEQELKNLFSMQGEAGPGGLYEELCKERNRISGEQDDAAREAIRKARLAKDRAARKKQEQEELLMTAGIFVFLGIGGIIVFVAIYYRG
jgi:hypothetical protein